MVRIWGTGIYWFLTFRGALCNAILRTHLSSLAVDMNCVMSPELGKLFGPSSLPGNISPGISCIYYLFGTNSADHHYQLRITYLDFPKEAPCEDLNLTIYNGFSTFSPVIREICSSNGPCGEIVIPLPEARFYAVFTVADSVTEPFKGFLAVMEKVSN